LPRLTGIARCDPHIAPELQARLAERELRDDFGLRDPGRSD
jgi:hypothetical protein